MKKNKFLLILLSIMNLHNYSQAVIESCALFTQDDKKVLILGDFHGCSAAPGSIVAEADKRDHDIIMQFIHKIADTDIKTLMILEASEWDILIKKEINFKGTLPFFAHDNLYRKAPNLDFEFGDIRTRPLRNFLELFSVVAQNQVPLFWVIMPQQLKKILGVDNSINDFLCDIEILTEDLMEKAKCLNSVKLLKFVEKSLNKINKQKLLIGLFFNEEEKRGSFIDFVADRILSSKLEMLNSCFCSMLSLTDRLTDIGFIIKLAMALDRHEQIILFAGNNHAITLHKFLKHFGFETNYIYGLTKKSKNGAIFIEPRFTGDQLNQLLNEAFNRSSTKEKVQVCAYCNVSQEKLSRCGACKNIYYCSRSCQSKDWSKHKLTCKRIN